MLLSLIAALAGGYLMGSIPFGLLIARIAGKGDIRTIGSGNIGATNVLRTGSKGLAALTLLCDLLKGTVPVVLAQHFAGEEAAIAAAAGAFLGHLFPVWLRFRGGKGVATYIGVLLGLSWHGALAFALAWLTIAVLTRYSSLAALVAVTVVPPVLLLLGKPLVSGVFIALGLLILLRHRANIARLLAGTEPRIGSGR